MNMHGGHVCDDPELCEKMHDFSVAVHAALEDLAKKHEVDVETIILCALDESVNALAKAVATTQPEARVNKVFWYIQSAISMLQADGVATVEYRDIAIETFDAGDVH